MKKKPFILSIKIGLFAFILLAGCNKDGEGDKIEIESEVQLEEDNNEIASEAQEAFNYLNQVRAEPEKYSDEIGVDLSYILPMHQLIWNDTLAEVAHNKAQDMSDRDYFGHVDLDGNGINIKIHEAGYLLPDVWIADKRANLFESLAIGHSDGIEAIKALIKDEGIDPPNHRYHLLGLNDFWAGCYDIGIGFVREDNPLYPTYSCIIIARHS